MTPAMFRALSKAAKRERWNICPIRGVHAAAETVLLAAMDRRGFIDWDGHPHMSSPRISRKGYRAIAEYIREPKE